MTKKSKKVWTYKKNDKGRFVKDKKTDLGTEWEEKMSEIILFLISPSTAIRHIEDQIHEKVKSY